MAISFHLHNELDVPVDTAQVYKEFRQLTGSMWPDDECVVYVAKPVKGLWVVVYRVISSKYSMK
jgi:hypothetical protein